LVYYARGELADIFAVDILHIIGVSIWLAIPLIWIPNPILIVVVMLLTVLGHYASELLLPTWLAAYITGTKGIGYFPLALWLPYCLLGLGIGRWIVMSQKPNHRKSEWKMMLVLTLIGLLSILSTSILQPSWGYRHPRPIFVAFSVAVLFWLLAGVWLWSERWKKRGPIMRLLGGFGRSSLLLYSFHLLVGYRLFFIIGWVNGLPWRGEYGVFNPPTSTGLLMGLVMLMMLVTFFRKKLQINRVLAVE
jgi:hypothetical protein